MLRPRGQGAQRGHKGARRPQGAQGCHKGAFFITGSKAAQPDTASKDRNARREQGRGPVGKRGLAAGRAGRKDRWIWTDSWKATVCAQNVRLSRSHDLKGAQELRWQPRGDVGSPAREQRPGFICAAKVTTFRRPSWGAGQRKRATGYVGARPDAGRAGSRESQAGASVLLWPPLRVMGGGDGPAATARHPELTRAG